MSRGTIEPFNLFGEQSLIWTKDEADRVLRANSYYILVAAAFSVILFLALRLQKMDIGLSAEWLLFNGILYAALGVAIRRFRSRVASVLALVGFGLEGLMRILEGNAGTMFFPLLFMAASYRCLKASFFYHRGPRPT